MSGGQPASAPASGNATRLNKVILDHEKLQQKHAALQTAVAESQQETDRKLKVLYQQTQLLNARIDELEKSKKMQQERIDVLEEVSQVKWVDGAGAEAENEGVEGAAAAEGAAAVNGASAVEVPDEDTIQRENDEALASKPVKNLINDSYEALLGTKLSGKNLPGYPFGIDREHETWPKDRATKKALVRFDWREGQHDSSINVEGREQVVAMVRTLAKQRGKTTTAYVEKIIPGQLEKKVRAKYLTLGAAYRAENKDDLEDDGEVDSKGMGSRVKSKLEARSRKRGSELCPADLKDPKWDTLMIRNAMSDDEDEPEYTSGDPRAFLSVEWYWRHKRVSEFFQHLDAVPDPKPDRGKLAVPRRRALHVKMKPPHTARQLRTRVRTYMVDEEVLAKNPDWLTTNKVALSGALWGKAEPIEDDGKKKRKAPTSTVGQRIVRRRAEESGQSSKVTLEELEKKMNDTLGGENVDSLFN
ncbi:hypothetical protein CONPUDRAFT_160537 [Coniophora puteana RWD-64-598 SS2]|uniref:Uncharacterized protein n=1 Tax=Coniophora puteana (strain RWD-64-598) TaxID=741705 RepID=R7SCS4_CONPW|nr:uncharacterized protein CONPUDRAFT_160537 [Coniophora puteana RWD-64-598 SS2]EIW73971.1 hypothetical protein CONPUDRAFT_160537 [Coniophora puteana RWD-64-598 SS2]